METIIDRLDDIGKCALVGDMLYQPLLPFSRQEPDFVLRTTHGIEIPYVKLFPLQVLETVHEHREAPKIMSQIADFVFNVISENFHIESRDEKSRFEGNLYTAAIINYFFNEVVPWVLILKDPSLTNTGDYGGALKRIKKEITEYFEVNPREKGIDITGRTLESIRSNLEERIEAQPAAGTSLNTLTDRGSLVVWDRNLSFLLTNHSNHEDGDFMVLDIVKKKYPHIVCSTGGLEVQFDYRNDSKHVKDQLKESYREQQYQKVFTGIRSEMETIMATLRAVITKQDSRIMTLHEKKLTYKGVGLMPYRSDSVNRVIGYVETPLAAMFDFKAQDEKCYIPVEPNRVGYVLTPHWDQKNIRLELGGNIIVDPCEHYQGSRSGFRGMCGIRPPKMDEELARVSKGYVIACHILAAEDLFLHGYTQYANGPLPEARLTREEALAQGRVFVNEGVRTIKRQG